LKVITTSISMYSRNTTAVKRARAALRTSCRQAGRQKGRQSAPQRAVARCAREHGVRANTTMVVVRWDRAVWRASRRAAAVLVVVGGCVSPADKRVTGQASRVHESRRLLQYMHLPLVGS
jgi:hypothetical protein